MAFAATLVEASNLTYAQLAIKWRANTLKAAAASFSTAAGVTFPDGDANSRPVGNWLVLIDAIGSTLAPFAAPPPQVVTPADFNQMVEYVARMCLTAFTLNTQTPQLVTPSQAVALLAAWNAAFGT